MINDLSTVHIYKIQLLRRPHFYLLVFCFSILVLLDGDTETAHKLHLKLMVDYVGEVGID